MQSTELIKTVKKPYINFRTQSNSSMISDGGDANNSSGGANSAFSPLKIAFSGERLKQTELNASSVAHRSSGERVTVVGQSESTAGNKIVNLRIHGNRRMP